MCFGMSVLHGESKEVIIGPPQAHKVEIVSYVCNACFIFGVLKCEGVTM